MKELANSITENVRKYKESKKTDFSRYSTARLLEEIKLHENNAETHLVIYYILKARQRPIVMCADAIMQLEREKRLSITPICLGHKNEAYLSEIEMLTEHNYTFESLSSSEKNIYNGMNKTCRIS
jgi:hypothetical protein